MNGPPHLSKSKVIAGKQCPLRLWLTCFSPELAEPPDVVQDAILDAGTEMGLAARQLFPGGAVVDDQDFTRALARTKNLAADRTVSAIFEGAFEHDRVRIRVDVLERLGRGTWGLREVKSSSGVKDVHLEDVAIQQYVLEGAGLRVPSAELIHVDTDYLRGEGAIDWQLFFKRVEVGALARERCNPLQDLVARLRRTLESATRPDVEPWEHCSTPYGCEFWSHCTREKPEDWIYHLPRVKTAKKERLRAIGVERITDIPPDFDLAALPARIRAVAQSGREFVSPELDSVLTGFGPPAYYLDFETMSPAIPLYSGTRPYERIPFQWSLHSVDGDGVLAHRDFLADGRSDPRRALAEGLLAALAESTTPIVVYSPFESSVLSDLARALPNLAPELRTLGRRLRDLLPVVQAHVYNPAFHCSFSLKSVAPALAPGFGYDDLEGIVEGGAAAAVYYRLASASTDGDAEDRIRKALLAYCRRDTLALVELHRALLRRRRQR